MKKYIHPIWYHKVPVKFDNNIIYITGSTCTNLSVEIWAKLHPAYKKNLGIKDYIILKKPIDIFKNRYNKKKNDY
nr:ribosomal protein L31 [Coccidia sp. AB-2023a]